MRAEGFFLSLHMIDQTQNDVTWLWYSMASSELARTGFDPLGEGNRDRTTQISG